MLFFRLAACVDTLKKTNEITSGVAFFFFFLVFFCVTHQPSPVEESRVTSYSKVHEDM